MRLRHNIGGQVLYLVLAIAQMLCTLTAQAQSGIGTISPTHALHVVDPAGDPVRFENLLARDAVADSTLLVTDPSTGVIRYLHIDSLNALLNNSPWYSTATNASATSNTDSVYINGRVGIFVDNPTYDLQVNSTALFATDDSFVAPNKSQSTFQGGSNVDGMGFVQTPWVYAHAIEAPREKAGNSTLITIGRDGQFNTGDDQISLITDGNIRLNVNSSGNVGIGTTVQTNPLQIAGRTHTTDFTMTNGAANGYLLQSNAAGDASWVDPTTISAANIYNTDGSLTANRAVTQGSFDLNFDANTLVVSGDDNRVGIGTANPSFVLDVNGSVHIGGNGTANSQGLQLTWNDANIGGTSQGMSGFLNHRGLGPGGFVWSQTNDNVTFTEFMRLTASGNLGIGTTVPGSRLGVAGRTTTTDFTMTNGAANGYILQSNATGAASWVDPISITTNIYNTNGTLTANRTVTTDGNNLNVAGLTAGTNSFQVNGGRVALTADGSHGVMHSLANTIFIANSNNGPTAATTANTGDGNFVWGVGDQSPSGPNYLERMRLTQTGLLGIGTNTPSSRLDVAGRTTTTDFTMTNGAANGYILQSNATGAAAWVDPTTISAANIYNTNGSLTANRAVTQGSFDLNFDANTLVVSGDDNRVGIGTANPSFVLDVNGSVHIGGNGTANSQGLQLTWNDANIGGTSQGMSGFLNHRGLGPGGFVWSQTNDNVTFTEFMRLTASGNLGIGTTVPGSRLGVAGRTTTTDFTMTNGAANGYILQSNATGAAAWVDPTTISAANIYNTNGSLTANRAVIQGSFDFNFDANTLVVSGDDNRVGVGTATPSQRLDVNGTILARNGLGNSGIVGSQLEFGFGGGTNYRHAIKTRHNGSDDARNAIDFYIWNLGVDAIGDEPTLRVLTIDGDNEGEVGIGIADPQSKLSVHDLNNSTDYTGNVQVDIAELSFRTNQFSVTNPNFSLAMGGLGLYAAYTTDTDRRKLGGVYGQIGSNQSGHLIFTTMSSGTELERMTITETGRVGIGTNAPTDRLSVYGGDVNFSKVNTPTNFGGILTSLGALEFGGIGRFTPSASIEATTTGWDDVADLRFSTSNGGGGSNAVRMTIRSNGNVGIGTTAPTQRLHVVGNIFATGTITTSDSTLKTNIQAYETDALAQIRRLNAVTYNWKASAQEREGYSDRLQIGFLAQEVREVIPEAVYGEEGKGMGLDFGKITPVIVKAMQQQQKTIDAQQQRIEKLEGELQAIKALLEK